LGKDKLAEIAENEDRMVNIDKKIGKELEIQQKTKGGV